MSADPSVHRERERRFFAHLHKLVQDDRLRVDTTGGRRPVGSLISFAADLDREIDLKRLMSQKGLPDRDLLARMPTGMSVDVALSRRALLLFRRRVGRILAASLPDWEPLLEGREPAPMTAAAVRQALAQLVRDNPAEVPTTVILVSTQGFTAEAHEVAERTARRTVILVEPNAAGGWTITAPPEIGDLADLLDPEADEEKEARIAAEIERQRADLLAGGLYADRVAAAVQLPLQRVESALRSFAAANGLTVKRLHGRVVVFKGDGTLSRPGEVSMGIIETFRTLFRGNDTQRKIAALSESRASILVQMDKAYADMEVVEKKEAQLKEEFAKATVMGTKKRIASQIAGIRKDLERRQQLVSVLRDKLGTIEAQLHSLELVKQGKTEGLPTPEEVAKTQAEAEATLADLQAAREAAGRMDLSSSMSPEDQAVFDELEAENAAVKAREMQEKKVMEEQESAANGPAEPARESASPVKAPPVVAAPPPLPAERAAKAEPG